jgi:hypothetical protein
VAERGKDIRFPAEGFEHRGAQRAVGGKRVHFLDGDQTPHVGKVQVARLVNRSHAAAAQHCHNFVAILQNKIGF